MLYTRSKWLSGFSFVVVNSAAIFVMLEREISPGVQELREAWNLERQTIFEKAMALELE